MSYEMVVGATVYEVDADLSNFKKGLDEAERRSKQSASSVKKHLLGLSAVAASVLPVAAASLGAVSVKMSRDFDKGIRETQTLLGDLSKNEIATLRKDTLQFMQDTYTLSNEAMPALYQAISAGVPRKNVFNFLQTANKAAVAGVTDLETSVDGLTSVVNAFSAQNLSAAKSADIMFSAVRVGKTTFGELSRALPNVSDVAANLDITFAEVAASMATLTTGGAKTAVASTRLRQVLVEIAKPGKDLEELLERAGIKSGQAALKIHGLQGTLQILEDAAADSGQSLLEFFSSQEAGMAALGLTGANAERAAAHLKATQNSAGATDAAFEDMAGSFDYLIRRFKASSLILIKLGDFLIPHISKALIFLLDIVDRVNIDKVISGIETSAKVIHRIVSGVVVAIIFGARHVGNVIDSILQMVGVDVFKVWTLVRALWSDLSDFIRAALNFDLDLPALIEKALSQLNQWKSDLGDWFAENITWENIVKTIMLSAEKLFQWTKTGISWLTAKVSNWWNRFTTWWNEQDYGIELSWANLLKLVGVIPAIADKVWQWVQDGVTWFQENKQRIWDSIVINLSKVVKVVGGIAYTIASKINEWLNNGAKWWLANKDRLWNTIVISINRVVKIAGDIMTKIKDKILEWWNEGVNWWNSLEGDTALDKITIAINDFIVFSGALAYSVKDKITAWWKAGLDWWKSIDVGETFETIIVSLDSFFEFILPTPVKDALDGWIDGLPSRLMGYADKVGNAIKRYFNGEFSLNVLIALVGITVFGKIAQMIKGPLYRAVYGPWDEIIEASPDPIAWGTKLKYHLTSWAGQAIDNLSIALPLVWAVNFSQDEMKETIKNFILNFDFEQFKTQFSDFITGFKDSVHDYIKDGVSDVVLKAFLAGIYAFASVLLSRKLLMNFGIPGLIAGLIIDVIALDKILNADVESIMEDGVTPVVKTIKGELEKLGTYMRDAISNIFGTEPIDLKIPLGNIDITQMLADSIDTEYTGDGTLKVNILDLISFEVPWDSFRSDLFEKIDDTVEMLNMEQLSTSTKLSVIVKLALQLPALLTLSFYELVIDLAKKFRDWWEDYEITDKITINPADFLKIANFSLSQWIVDNVKWKFTEADGEGVHRLQIDIGDIISFSAPIGTLRARIMAAFITIFENWKVTTGQIEAAIQQAQGGVTSTIFSIPWSSIVGIGADTAFSIADFVADVGQLVWDWVTTNATALGKQINEWLTARKNTVNIEWFSISRFVQAPLLNLVEMATELAQLVWNWVTDNASAISTKVNAWLTDRKNTVSIVWTQLLGFAAATPEQVETLATSFVDFVKTLPATISTKVNEWITQKKNFVSVTWTELVAFKDATVEQLGQLKDSFIEKFGQFTNEIWDPATGKMKVSLITVPVGQILLDGFKKGLAASEPLTKARSLFQTALRETIIGAMNLWDRRDEADQILDIGGTLADQVLTNPVDPELTLAFLGYFGEVFGMFETALRQFIDTNLENIVTRSLLFAVHMLTRAFTVGKLTSILPGLPGVLLGAMLDILIFEVIFSTDFQPMWDKYVYPLAQKIRGVFQGAVDMIKGDTADVGGGLMAGILAAGQNLEGLAVDRGIIKPLDLDWGHLINITHDEALERGEKAKQILTYIKDWINTDVLGTTTVMDAHGDAVWYKTETGWERFIAFTQGAAETLQSIAKIIAAFIVVFFQAFVFVAVPVIQLAWTKFVEFAQSGAETLTAKAKEVAGFISEWVKTYLFGSEGNEENETGMWTPVPSRWDRLITFVQTTGTATIELVRALIIQWWEFSKEQLNNILALDWEQIIYHDLMNLGMTLNQSENMFLQWAGSVAVAASSATQSIATMVDNVGSMLVELGNIMAMFLGPGLMAGGGLMATAGRGMNYRMATAAARDADRLFHGENVGKLLRQQNIIESTRARQIESGMRFDRSMYFGSQRGFNDAQRDSILNEMQRMAGDADFSEGVDPGRYRHIAQYGESSEDTLGIAFRQDPQDLEVDRLLANMGRRERSIQNLGEDYAAIVDPQRFIKDPDFLMQRTLRSYLGPSVSDEQIQRFMSNVLPNVDKTQPRMPMDRLTGRLSYGELMQTYRQNLIKRIDPKNTAAQNQAIMNYIEENIGIGKNLRSQEPAGDVLEGLRHLGIESQGDTQLETMRAIQRRISEQSGELPPATSRGPYIPTTKDGLDQRQMMEENLNRLIGPRQALDPRYEDMLTRQYLLEQGRLANDETIAKNTLAEFQKDFNNRRTGVQAGIAKQYGVHADVLAGFDQTKPKGLFGVFAEGIDNIVKSFGPDGQLMKYMDDFITRIEDLNRKLDGTELGRKLDELAVSNNNLWDSFKSNFDYTPRPVPTDIDMPTGAGTLDEAIQVGMRQTGNRIDDMTKSLSRLGNTLLGRFAIDGTPSGVAVKSLSGLFGDLTKSVSDFVKPLAAKETLGPIDTFTEKIGKLGSTLLKSTPVQTAGKAGKALAGGLMTDAEMLMPYTGPAPQNLIEETDGTLTSRAFTRGERFSNFMQSSTAKTLKPIADNMGKIGVIGFILGMLIDTVTHPNFMKDLGNLIEAIGNFANVFGSLEVVMIGVGAALLVLAGPAGVLAMLVGIVISVLGPINVLTLAISALQLVIGIVTGIAAAFAYTLAGIFHGILRIVNLFFDVTSWMKGTEGFMNAMAASMDNSGQGIENAASGIATAVGNMFENTKEAISTLDPSSDPIGVDVDAYMALGDVSAYDAPIPIDDFVPEISDATMLDFSVMFDPIKDSLKGVGTWITETGVPTVVNAIKGIWTSVNDWFTNTFSISLKDLFNVLFTLTLPGFLIRVGIPALVEAFKALGAAIIGWFTGSIEDHGDALAGVDIGEVGFEQTFMDKIKQIFLDSPLALLKNPITGIAAKFVEVFTDLKTQITGKLGEIGTAIGNKIDEWKEKISGFSLGGLAGGAGNFIGGLNPWKNARGGLFKVQGMPGTDNVDVNFKATAGEIVAVGHPRQLAPQRTAVEPVVPQVITNNYRKVEVNIENAFGELKDTVHEIILDLREEGKDV